jgi:carbonic anhydrase
MSHGPSLPPSEALKKLMEGNQRFIKDQNTHHARVRNDRRQELLQGQAPYAAVLTCADSRVAPEHIFDAGLGEIFVVRNAGNLLDEVVVGSLEYAAAHTGCPVAFVLGHRKCGAINATLSVAKSPDAHETPNVDDIVRRLMPAVMATRVPEVADADWADAAAKKNVVNVCVQLAQRSPLLAGLAAKGQFKIVGGYYDLASGQVELLID